MERKDNDENLTERLKKWREAQREVASQVVILPDNDNDNDKIGVNEPIKRYKIIRSPHCSTKSTKINNTNQHTDKPEKSAILYGGVDVSFTKPGSTSPQEENLAVATYVILQQEAEEEQLKVVYKDFEFFELNVPYVSSYLSFREIHPLQRLIKKQTISKPTLTPKIIFVDGNGILHQRSAGIACFVGVYMGIPAIGVSKSLHQTDGLTVEFVNKALHDRVQDLLNDMKSRNGDGAGRIFQEEKLPSQVQEQQQPQDKMPNEQNSNSPDDILSGPPSQPFLHESCNQELGRVVVLDRHHIDSRENEISSADLTEKAAFSKTPQQPQQKAVQVSKEQVKELSTYMPHACFAVKLVGQSGRLWGAALLGHGGGSTNKPQPGTKNAIFISVGHLVSLEASVALCAGLSLARIPEPVRVADLYGRELIRNRCV